LLSFCIFVVFPLFCAPEMPQTRIMAMGFLTSVYAAVKMNCGSAPLCGVLVMETGYGSGAYHQDLPGVHGIWPETGSFGTSQCIKPRNSSNPTKVYDCYDNDGDNLLGFETHEWEKHGCCAGVKNADDFFTQMCGLSDHPLAVLISLRESGASLDTMSSALQSAGYEVFSLDQKNSQVYLSVCAGYDGQWKHSTASQFSSMCGGGPSPSPPPSPSPTPSPTPTGQCLSHQHGPPCYDDSQCNGVTGCIRCARSGYCTDVPLMEEHV